MVNGTKFINFGGMVKGGQQVKLNVVLSCIYEILSELSQGRRTFIDVSVGNSRNCRFNSRILTIYRSSPLYPQSK